MKTTFTLVTAVALLLLVGCNASQSTPSAPAASNGSASSGPAATSQGTSETGKTSGAIATQTPPATTADPTSPEKTANAEKTASEDAAKKEAETKKPPHELIAGIDNPRLVSSFEEFKRQADESPKDWRAQLQYVSVLQSVGQERMRKNESEKAYKTFGESAKVARKFIETKAEVPEVAHNLLANVFYNEACVSSRAKDSRAAIAAIDEAMKWGFTDFSMVEKDEDLAALRADPGFSEKLDKWKQMAREIAMKKAQEELASAKSFPFDFSLTDVDGKPIKLADLRGKVVIVDIWGTWCPPCRAEIPSFVKLQSTYGEKGFQMVGLNEENETGDEAVKSVKEFIKAQDMNYPCALIDESTKNQVPDFEGYPTTLFIDKAGKVRLKAVGLHEYSYLEAIVTTLLEEPAAAATPAAATPAAATPAPASSTPAAPASKS